MTSYDPFEHAQGLGIQVLDRAIVKAHGYWVPEYSTIVLRSGLAPSWRRAACAHEIGHALLEHTESTPNNEWEANRIAFWNLVDSEELQVALDRWQDVLQVARSLRVTTAMLNAGVSPIAPRGARG